MDDPIEEEKLKLGLKLMRQVYDVFVYLGYPEFYEVKYEGAVKSSGDHLRHSADDVCMFMDHHHFDTASHTARTIMYSSAVSDFLGLYNQRYYEARVTLLESASGHDKGKLDPSLTDLIEKRQEFTPEERVRMKKHLEWGVALNDTDIGAVSAVIGMHHNWQREGYSLQYDASHQTLTDEVKILSKLLGIIDFYDSVSTRVNKRNFDNPRLPTKDEAKHILMEEYGELPIEYKGEQMPELSLKGKSLIESLYSAEIFGRDFFDPFPKPYSFIWRPGWLQKKVAQIKARGRGREIERKIRKYRQKEDQAFWEH
jgi:response regulator RpfG family c-di-GMP phosphodiesterase